MELRKRFKLFDFEQKQAPPADLGAKSLEQAVAIYSRPILNTIDRAPNHEMCAHDLKRELDRDNDEMDLDYEKFSKLIQTLADMELIEIVERDSIGNHKLRRGRPR